MINKSHRSSFSVSISGKMCKTSKTCDAGSEPCLSGGVSPSMHIALPCFTGAFLTGHPSLPVRNFGLQSLTEICALVGGVLRVESPSALDRTKEARITSLFFQCPPARHHFRSTRTPDSLSTADQAGAIPGGVL